MTGFFYDERHTILSAPHGLTNADIIAEAAEFYIKDGMTVADVTYGQGIFWRRTGTARFKLLKSDIADGIDFRKLPYEDKSIDVVVLDPPYVHDASSSHMAAGLYKNETTKGMNHDAILNLYSEGMTEAIRVLKPGGQLWVKCKDEVEAGRQRWSHIEIYLKAIQLGMIGKDIFVLNPTARINVNRWSTQRHARKNHSYLWIFEK